MAEVADGRPGTAPLSAARDRLREANGPAFTTAYHEGYEERAAALAEPMEVLRRGGEAAIPHLGVLLFEGTWASNLAVELLAKMPAGPLRDRALVEAMFAELEWLPDTAAGAFERAVAGHRESAWIIFEEVVRTAARDGIELQGSFWHSLLEIRGAEEDTFRVRPGPHLGRALILLYDLGHLGALADLIDFRLDEFFSGPDIVHLFVHDPGVMAAVAAMESRPPGRLPRPHAVDSGEATETSDR